MGDEYGADLRRGGSVKVCTVCGAVTSRSGSRCTVHARQSNRSRNNPFYQTRTWQRLSRRVIARHRGQYGNTCPGYGREAHPASDMTADHIVPLAAGGAPLDLANLAVLCRSCNSTKGAAVADGGRGYPHGEAPSDERARRLYIHGRVSRKIPLPGDAPDGRQVGPRARHGAGGGR
jgi:5-methylcytosine-specific restriction protein A